LDTASKRDLDVLEAVSRDRGITQRSLASRLGIAVGLTNLYLKRLARKGYIKFVYLLTPKGIAEKSRLTYEYMEHSMFVYRQVRTHLSSIVQPWVASGGREIALYGTGEAAELAYLCLRQHGLEPVAVFDDAPSQFLGMAVQDIRAHGSVAFDLIIIARLERSEGLLAELTGLGIARDRLVPLRPPRSRGGAREHVGRRAASATSPR
jgi:hypothetical protein